MGHEFLLNDALRPVSLQLELLNPELIMKEHHIASTIVMCGSAGIPAPRIAAEASASHDPSNDARPRSA
jgi:hypothetical protein